MFWGGLVSRDLIKCTSSKSPSRNPLRAERGGGILNLCIWLEKKKRPKIPAINARYKYQCVDGAPRRPLSTHLTNQLGIWPCLFCARDIHSFRRSHDATSQILYRKFSKIFHEFVNNIVCCVWMWPQALVLVENSITDVSAWLQAFFFVEKMHLCVRVKVFALLRSPFLCRPS